jgi:thiosulfate dehydrogenase
LDQQNTIDKLLAVINTFIVIIAILVSGMVFIVYYSGLEKKPAATIPSKIEDTKSPKSSTITFWQAKDINQISDKTLKEKVVYGKKLIANTSQYFGPLGSVATISNGMNCQNCHLDAGTVVYGNNYGSVFSLYPKFRARSGTIENIYKRVNDCIQRSLNGIAIDSNSKEMQAIVAYINYIGSNVEKGKKAEGSGFKDLAFLDRAADPINGKSVYVAKCQSCHQTDGNGLLNSNQKEYIYPPLWGEHSFNDGAGLYRISNFAKYVKYNMPQGTTFNSPQLTDEEAWDVAAFVVAQKRPHKDVPKDWPDISKKPIDHPFGPYADRFTETQHKFGPFKPISEEQKKNEALSKNFINNTSSKK